MFALCAAGWLYSASAIDEVIHALAPTQRVAHVLNKLVLARVGTHLPLQKR
jgi:hypothetical protein